MPHQISVLLHTPAYSQVAGPLTYLSEQKHKPGTLVRVPLGQRELLGVVWDAAPDPAAQHDTAPVLDAAKLRPIAAALDALAPLNPAWRALVSFAASYYQRSPGEVALAALPPQLRDLNTLQLARRLKKQPQKPPSMPPDDAANHPAATSPDDCPGLCTTEPRPSNATTFVALTQEQTRAIAQFDANDGPFLLFGATGSGKTEVFMHCTADVLGASDQSQVLVMVPEINLTPQLEERFRARFANGMATHAVVSMHSGMTPAQRLRSWLAAHSGLARVVLGTRMAVFASAPHLKLIVVDEEHDPSYKQQEGARYSARDLAVYRGRLEGARVILGSATPSLESWYHSRPKAEGGRYLRLAMPSRIGADARLPLVRRVDMNHQPKRAVFSPPLLDAIRERIARGEQSMVFLNRRGYAPVLPAPPATGKAPARIAVPTGCFTRSTAPALPPLRLCRAGATRLPRMRQHRHHPGGPRHRTLQEQLALLFAM
jgi:primosomal protein N' (replication factor Y)